MPTALFYNFSDEDFTGMWGGQTKLFPAGSKTYMPAYLAQHFAKHLTNRELHKKGLDNATSPKNPEDVPEFLKLFRTAYVRDRDMELNSNSLESEINAVNLNRQPQAATVTAPKVDMPVSSTSGHAPIVAAASSTKNELDLNAPVPVVGINVGPGKEPQIIGSPDDEGDEDGDDENSEFVGAPKA